MTRIGHYTIPIFARKMEHAVTFMETLILFFVYICGALATIEKLDLIMPRYAIRGGDVVLKCDHSVSPEQLYKVEWQKGGNKIFQYIKGRTPPFRLFPTMMTGAVLDKANSNEKQIQLSKLDFAASGSYSCVVSMDTPIFSKDSENHVLTVIEPQSADPQITFNKGRYEFKEILEANCTSAPSRPPPHITWFVNDNKVPDDMTKSFSNGRLHGHGYFEQKASSTKQLSIKVSKLHVGEDGELRLTCMSTIPGYINENEDYADIRKHSVRLFVEAPEEPEELTMSGSSSSSNSGKTWQISSILSVLVVVAKALF